MTTNESRREPGYRGSLPPRNDRLAAPWMLIVIGIFVLVIVLSVLGIPSRFIEPEPTASPTPRASATATASGEASASPSDVASAGASASAAASAEASVEASASPSE
jgi:hypothetical protein